MTDKIETVDCLSIGVEINSYDKDTLVVMRHRYDDKVDVLNVIQGEEAVELYYKLIGSDRTLMRNL